MTGSIKRRKFLRHAAAGSAVMTFGTTAPSVLCRAAALTPNEQRVLVVVEMAGGNDGLNSVVPHSDPVYRKSRENLRINKADTLAIDSTLGLHPAMRGCADLLEQGRFAIVQGVGYPNPNRSHFESMDIWHSCLRKDTARHDGWIGRYLDAAKLGDAADPAALHLGNDKQPFALMSRDIRVPSIQSLQQFRLRDNGSIDLKAAIREFSRQTGPSDAVAPANDLLDFVQSSTSSAIVASERMESATKKHKSGKAYPTSGLARKLETVSKLIASGIQTRVYYVRIDGFDTHANQVDAHAALLREVSDAVSALVGDLDERGDGDRVLVMCFSEFGRRVAQNASDGTDHGTAGPVFFAGNAVRPGLIGNLPSLSNLENGDLKYHTDFRRVYAAVLKDWLECDPRAVLAGNYEPVKLLKS
ncbi:MAG: DUF1501 domain-containing protein [Pirellulaceae bacterium]|nr:DUF1501 domain-containing protein [Pirellulaceae bacterium]